MQKYVQIINLPNLLVNLPNLLVNLLNSFPVAWYIPIVL